MKRYDLVGNYDMSIQEMLDGDYCLHEEAAAIIAEKDQEIASLTQRNTDLIESEFNCICAQLDLQEQLRTSNEALAISEANLQNMTARRDLLREALVAAQARIAELEQFTGRTGWLEVHDKEVRTPILNAWDDLLEDLELYGMHGFEPYIKSRALFGRMAAELRNKQLQPK